MDQPRDEARVQLLDDRTITAQAFDLVCRERMLRPLLFLALSLPLGVGLLGAVWFLDFGWGGLFGGVMSVVAAGVLIVCGMLTLLIAGFCAAAVRAAMAPSNWLLRARPDGIFLRFRSHHNGFAEPGEPVAVFLPKNEIAYLQNRVIRTLGRDAEGGETQNHRDELRIRLTHGETADLVRALARERGRSGVRRFGISTAARHYPVRLADDNEIIVDWAGPDKSTHPTLDKLLPMLASQFPVRDITRHGHVPYEQLSRAEQEDQLAELVAAGDILSAVKIAKELYGFDTTQAQDFVDRLRR